MSLALLCMTLALTAAAVHADLVVPSSSTYTTDQRWFLADSPVTVNGVLTIAGFGSLTIDPGVVVNMAPDAFIVNQRTLRVLGTQELPVSPVSLKLWHIIA